MPRIRTRGAADFTIGALGATAHLAFARAFDDDPRLATGAGASYTDGILLQFATNLAFPQVPSRRSHSLTPPLPSLFYHGSQFRKKHSRHHRHADTVR